MDREILNYLGIVCDLCGLEMTDFEAERESADYLACGFKLNGRSVKFRRAHITPTKTGQFVTLWKRREEGSIAPFDISDEVDLVVVAVKMEERFGQFVFPKSVLLDKGIFSGQEREGKRAIRVYPPWDQTTSRQARKTQEWQLDYFLEIRDEGVEVNQANRLFL